MPSAQNSGWWRAARLASLLLAPLSHRRFPSQSYPTCQSFRVQRVERRETLFKERRAALEAAGEVLDESWYPEAENVLKQLREQPESEPFREPILPADVRCALSRLH